MVRQHRKRKTGEAASDQEIVVNKIDDKVVSEFVDYSSPSEDDTIQEIDACDDLIGSPTEIHAENSSTLKGRLGMSSRRPEETSLIYAFPDGFLDTLNTGVVSEYLFKEMVNDAVQQQHHIEVSLTTKPLSSFDFDEKFNKIFPPKSQDKNFPLITPKFIDYLLARMEESHDFFPKNTIKLLLDRHLISDQAHSRIIDRILGKGQLELVVKYITNVDDLQEQSLFKVVEYFLTIDASKINSIRPFGGFDRRECLLLLAINCRLDVASLKPFIMMLSGEQVFLMLVILQKLLQNYSLVHAETFILDQNTKPLQASIPSKLNTINWIDGIIDSHYPSLLYNSKVVEILQSIGDLTLRDIMTTDGLVRIKAMTMTVSFIASIFPRSAEKPIPNNITCEDYSIDIVSF